MIDVAASLAACARQNAGGAVKVAEDLDRYERILASTRPEVLVECGTWLGGSARWFAARGPRVITVDKELGLPREAHPNITWLWGDSTHPGTVTEVARLVAGRRSMVVLDSDHGREHVAAEIAAYGPFVAPGCYLVVEDGIVAYQDEHPWIGSPLDAALELLAGDPRWRRDTQIEALHPVSMHPAGWWLRTGEPWT